MWEQHTREGLERGTARGGPCIPAPVHPWKDIKQGIIHLPRGYGDGRHPGRMEDDLRGAVLAGEESSYPLALAAGEGRET